jgi:hypothetical protein
MLKGRRDGMHRSPSAYSREDQGEHDGDMSMERPDDPAAGLAARCRIGSLDNVSFSQPLDSSGGSSGCLHRGVLQALPFLTGLVIRRVQFSTIFPVPSNRR